jgi:putative transposase
MKYSPMFPGKFRNLEDLKQFGQQYFDWYNHDHRHSGIAYLTPAVVHAGAAEAELEVRYQTRLRAWSEHPERFVGGPPRRETLPPAVYINPPIEEAATKTRSPVVAPSTEALH